MEKLREIFGENSLTWEQLEEKLKESKEIKLANLASGNYVDKKKFEDKVAELATANSTISGLQDTVKKFDGVDVEKLKKDAADWEAKYNTDLAAAKLDSAVSLALIKAKAKDPELTKKALDMSLLKLDGEKVLGLDEQITNLRSGKGFLFDPEDEDNGGNGGARVNTGGNHTGNHNTDSFLSALMKGAGLENEKE